MSALASQRDRWQRGLIQSLVRHRQMIGRRRYGVIGVFALPYFVVFEMLGPLIELAGYATMATSLALGWASATMAALFLCLAMLGGLLFSFGALAIEERAFQRYRRWRCLGRLALAAFVENFGYRQLNTCLRARAFWTLLRRKDGWGEMVRTGYAVELPVLGDGSSALPVPGGSEALAPVAAPIAPGLAPGPQGRQAVARKLALLDSPRRRPDETGAR